MKLFHYKAPEGNFGDDLNEWLWDELVPGLWDREDDTLFCGIGTILGNAMPPARRVRVFSSGIGYRPPPADLNDPRWEIMALRGPLTAHVLGRPEKAVADGALLLATLPRFRPLEAANRRDILFVPHFQAMEEGDWARACALSGVTLLDPRQPADRVIARIRTARLVIADSMHAAIVADTMRVPWVPVASSPRINSFKWLDWTLSLDLPYEPTPLPSVSLSAAYQGMIQPLIGRGHRLVRARPEAALAHYYRTMRRELAGGWRARWMPRLGYHLGMAPRRLPRPPLVQKAVRAFDQRQTERIAGRFDRLCASGGYLSGDRIFHQRVEQLESRLATLI